MPICPYIRESLNTLIYLHHGVLCHYKKKLKISMNQIFEWVLGHVYNWGEKHKIIYYSFCRKRDIRKCTATYSFIKQQYKKDKANNRDWLPPGGMGAKGVERSKREDGTDTAEMKNTWDFSDYIFFIAVTLRNKVISISYISK